MSTKRKSYTLANGPAGGGGLSLTRMSLADLTPANYNPRTISDAAMKGLEHSIDRFGLVQPIVWNKRTGNIVGGHQRLAALLNRGATEADVYVVDLPEVEEKALNLALNNPGIQGEFTAAVVDIIEELQAEVPDLVAELDLGAITAQVLDEAQEITDRATVPDDGIDYQSQFAVAVICRDETHQNKVYEDLTDQGYGELKVLVI